MDLMRQLEVEHKRLWDNLSPRTPEMVAARDCDPALLSGWTDRDISLWDVSGSDGKPTLKEILVALCRRKQNWEKISYLRFPEESVTLVGLTLTSSNGKTGDQRVDNSHTHFEIKGITGKELCTLLFHLSNGEFETGIFTKKELERILYESYDTMTTRPVVQSATSKTSNIGVPPSGTVVQEVPAVGLPIQSPSETLIVERIPRPNSSTTSALSEPNVE